jgi:PLP dependent protein
MSIAGNLRTIQERIQLAALRSERAPDSVRLVAVSKTQPVSAVVEAAESGQQIFGENYVQEFLEKCRSVTAPVSWHFIGSLQSNKVKYLTGLTSLIHSIDRLSLAQEISRQWEKTCQTCDILLQVNIAGESTKSGAAVSEAVELARKVSLLPNIRIRGLMTIPPFFDEPERARPFFRELRKIAELIDEEHITGVEMRELSMGMSGDFEVAIEEGATLVRVGTAIFGERDYR